MSSLIWTFNFNSLVYSPLDQFCDEETEFQEFCRKYIVDIDYFDIIEELELLATISVGVLAGSVLSIELESNDEELEWDETDAALTMNQAAVLTSNLSGVVPGSETVTAELSLVFMLSFATVISYIFFGFVLHEHRYMSIIFPAGTYIVMAPFILMIELISFLARAISLGMRLFANMFAGHSLFKIIYTFSWITLMSPYFVFSFLMLGLAILLSFLEAGIAYLQAYVYGSLTNMYHSESIALSH